MRQKTHLLTEKLVNAHLKPRSRVRQNTSYRSIQLTDMWCLCQIFRQLVPTALNIVIMMTSRHLCPGSDHTHSCNGRQAPRRIPQPEKDGRGYRQCH